LQLTKGFFRLCRDSSLETSLFTSLLMKIFGNCLVKNEADMIEETLIHASKWCDRIFVFDNGSTDGTWDRVLALARLLPKVVVPYKSEGVPYRDSLRKDTFAHYRHECSTGDWWCKLDADEVYIDDPRKFLERVPTLHHVVWGVSFQFYFTDKDGAAWTADSQAYPPHAPAALALRHYRCEYSEIRFFRYRPGLRWDQGSAPRHLGVVHPRRIRFRHYQYRSPEQIELRLKTRQAAIAGGCGTFQGYCEETDWMQKMVPAYTCHTIGEETAFLIEEDKIPVHIEPKLQRMIKLVMHGTGIWP
jgi:hypothetical protein